MDRTIYRDLLKKKNVVMVGLGIKMTDGVSTGMPAIVIGVSKKEPLTALSAGDIIPREVKGMETDVVQVGEIVALGSKEWTTQKRDTGQLQVESLSAMKR